jgi:hypothetical protein
MKFSVWLACFAVSTLMWALCISALSALSQL